MASVQGPSWRSRAAMAAVRATTRACWPARVAWSRQASRLARSARAHASACGAIGQVGNRGRRCWRGRPGRGGPGLAGQAGLGDGGGVLVVVQQVPQRLVAVGGGVGGGEVPGVAADEVVHAVAAVAGLGQQALAVQGVQLPGGVLASGMPARAAAA